MTTLGGHITGTADAGTVHMGIGQRLWDDGVFVPEGDNTPQPVFVNALLARLGLLDAPRDKQESGIATWLQSNQPSKTLIISLERQGFGDLLH
ncbi:hypothetical protein ABLE92_20085 [Gordonia sp. VNQ95]|uniref:hypothetical protein n=1 Tax=Gordonia sp. VNQ95 TaxID=3156619 RepID=UPI0032B45D43